METIYEKVNDKTVKVTKIVPSELIINVDELKQKLINLQTTRADRDRQHNFYVTENEKETQETHKLIQEAKKLGIE